MKRILKWFCFAILAVSLLSSISFQAEAAEQLKSGIGIVTAGPLRLRSGPSLESPIMTSAEVGDKVVVIREVGDWYLVNYNLKIGYMYKTYVKLKTEDTVKLGYALFQAETNVRSGPGTNTSILDTAPQSETCFVLGFRDGWYMVSYNGTLGYVRSDLVSLLEKPYENSGKATGSFEEELRKEQEKLQFVFGTTDMDDPRLFYDTEEEALSHMEDIVVYTWDLDESGNKYARSWYLTVNERIAPKVSALFSEVFALPDQPPIHALGGYRWDDKSEHSIGLAIDMNPMENYYCNPDGQALVGKYFRPDQDPYSIPIDGSLDQVFAKYGFIRGINWNSGFKDFMHYSYLGS